MSALPDPLSTDQTPRTLLFDWDGTLVDSLDLLFSAHNHVRAHMGVPLMTREEAKASIRESAREVFPRLFGDRSEEAKKVLYDYISEHHVNQTKALDGADSFLRALQARGFTMGVVSNKTHLYLLREIEALGWSDLFSAVIGAGQAERDKPDAAPLRMALSALGQEPGRDVWYLGDTEVDLLCARNAGCASVLLLHGWGGPELIERYAPDYVYDGFPQLQAALGAR